jgi:hypothetical protein
MEMERADIGMIVSAVVLHRRVCAAAEVCVVVIICAVPAHSSVTPPWYRLH